jgi:acyl carrier protein
MTKDELFVKIKDILVREFALSPEQVSPGTSLFTELELDSIDAVDLIVKMKPYIAGKVDPSLFKNVRTVWDVVDVIFPLVETGQTGNPAL